MCIQLFNDDYPIYPIYIYINTYIYIYIYIYIIGVNNYSNGMFLSIFNLDKSKQAHVVIFSCKSTKATLSFGSFDNSTVVWTNYQHT